MLTSENTIQNYSLKSHNSFRFDCIAEYYTEVKTPHDIELAVDFADQNNLKITVLGGGSNIVFVNPKINGLVVRPVEATENNFSYKKISGSNVIHVTATAGSNWHSLVLDTIEKGLGGLENLSLIPGTVGAAPIQNIGAYGVELNDRFVSLRAFHIPTKKWQTLSTEDCEFSYRDSLFKHEHDQFIISDVTLAVSSTQPTVTNYRDVTEYLQNNGIQKADFSAISHAICVIRGRKLPDPAKLPNAGSFFHNPVISGQHFRDLETAYPGIVGYPQPNGQVKVAAGWLIDTLGLKGYTEDGIGVHKDQALVLVHFGESNGKTLIRMANFIRQRVESEFDIKLDIEPRLL